MFPDLNMMVTIVTLMLNRYPEHEQEERPHKKPVMNKYSQFDDRHLNPLVLTHILTTFHSCWNLPSKILLLTSSEINIVVAKISHTIITFPADITLSEGQFGSSIPEHIWTLPYDSFSNMFSTCMVISAWLFMHREKAPLWMDLSESLNGR